MSNWDVHELTIEIPFLLSDTYKFIVFEDAINTYGDGTDFKLTVVNLTSKDKLGGKAGEG